MISLLLSFVFPSKEKDTISPAILSLNERPVQLNQFALRGQGIMHLDSLTACVPYASSKPLQEVIRRFKYHRRRALAVPLGALLLEAAAYIPLEDEMMICAVPLHWTRRFSRGFNQAELLAHEISTATGIHLSTCLRRVRPTGHQAWRLHDERRLAMCSAFAATRAPSHVLLVDDVATTISTLDACAGELKKAGATHVHALVIALG